MQAVVDKFKTLKSRAWTSKTSSNWKFFYCIKGKAIAYWLGLVLDFNTRAIWLVENFKLKKSVISSSVAFFFNQFSNRNAT